MSKTILAACCHGTFVVASCLAVCLVTVARPASAESLQFGPDGAIAGRVADMRQQTQTMGQTFRLGFNGIRYEGAVDRAEIEHATPETLTVKMALRNIRLTISNIQIDGTRRGAQCGPMQLTLGTERELWISFKVKRTLEEGKTKLIVLEANFDLPGDNWRIGSPSWVRSWGFGMTESRVVSGLRSGLASNRAAIEWQLGEESTGMFSQLEERLVAHLESNPRPASEKLAARQNP
ncbi:MAG: hypothetical protein ABI614_19035, partial [Planctomycetota bacterium]